MEKQHVFKYNSYLYIWGAQWIVSALLIYFWSLESNHITVTITIGIAALCSLLVFGLSRKQRTAAPSTSHRSQGSGGESIRHAQMTGSKHPTQPSVWVLPILYILVSGGLLLYAADQVYFLFDLLRALVLGFIYMVLGIRLGRELIYLSIWLLALVAILTIWYLGFAPLVLLFFGGLSLIACAIIFRIWGVSKPSIRRSS